MKNIIKTGTTILCAMLLSIGAAGTKHIEVAAESAEAGNSITIKGVNYHVNDYSKFAEFLKQPSGEKGETNAQVLGFDINDPTTWKNTENKEVTWYKEVSWNKEDPKRITGIMFEHYDISGALSVENFIKLSYLSISSIDITSINTRGCDALEVLRIVSGNLKKLNVKNNTKLEVLDCSSNKIKQLDVSQNINLRKLDCSDNRIQILDVSKNRKLQGLECDGNRLKKLNVSNNEKLQELFCSSNKLKKLDIGKNKNLERLWCGDNQITNLNLQKNKKLKDVDCSNNKLKKLNMGKVGINFFDLFDCQKNRLTKISLKSSKKTFTLKTKGKGYVGLLTSDDDDHEFEVWATPKKGYKFVNWTENGKVFSKEKYIALSKKKSYNLKANFKRKL